MGAHCVSHVRNRLPRRGRRRRVPLGSVRPVRRPPVRRARLHRASRLGGGRRHTLAVRALRPASEYAADDGFADYDNDYGVTLWADAAAVADPCSGDPDADAGSPAAIAAALAARADLVVERSTGQVAGLPAEVVDVRVTDRTDADCPDGGQAVIASRSGPPTTWQVGCSRGDRLRIALVEIAGRTMAVVLADDSNPPRFDALVAAAQPIIESFALAGG